MTELSRMDKRKGKKRNTEAVATRQVETQADTHKVVRRKKKRLPAIFRILILLLVVSFVAYTGYQVMNFVTSPLNEAEDKGNNAGLEISGEMEPGDIAEDPKDIDKEPIRILLLGVDERKHEPSRSDTIIYATIFPKEKQIKLLSIPRDTRVAIPGHGSQKINHSHVYGGVKLMRTTVENFTDQKIDYYLETNFNGFKNIIDLLGGVTIDVKQRMYKPTENIDIQEGLQTLNGYDALGYVRFRGDGRGDIGRVERQQKFLKTLADHAVSIGNVWKIPDLMSEVKDNIKTDMSLKDIIYLATKFSDMETSKIEMNMVPGFAGMKDSVSYWIPDKSKTKEIIEKMSKPTVEQNKTDNTNQQ